MPLDCNVWQKSFFGPGCTVWQCCPFAFWFNVWQNCSQKGAAPVAGNPSRLQHFLVSHIQIAVHNRHSACTRSACTTNLHNASTQLSASFCFLFCFKDPITPEWLKAWFKASQKASQCLTLGFPLFFNGVHSHLSVVLFKNGHSKKYHEIHLGQYFWDFRVWGS